MVMEYVVFIASSAVIIITRASVTDEDTEKYVYIHTVQYIRMYVATGACTYVYTIATIIYVHIFCKSKHLANEHNSWYIPQ